jgi:hypothetical protein
MREVLRSVNRSENERLNKEGDDYDGKKLSCKNSMGSSYE